MDQYVFNAPEKNLDPPAEVETCDCPSCGGSTVEPDGVTQCGTCVGYGELPETLCSDICEAEQIHAVRCAWCGAHINCGIFPVSYGMCDRCATDPNLFSSEDVRLN